MQSNNVFSFQRFLLLGKQSLIINKKMIGIGLIGFAGVMFILLMYIHSRSRLSTWEIKNYNIIFHFLFVITGIIFSSLSFPSFRSKEKSMDYILLPSSISEKFVFEFMSRIVVFIILMPLLFWVVANLEGALMHTYYPEFVNYKFSFREAYNRNSYGGLNECWTNFLIIQTVLFVFIFSFVGASHFSKSPLQKTLFTFSILAAGYGLLFYLLGKVLELKEFEESKSGMFFFQDKNDALILGGIFVIVINISLLAIAFFRLKEKEV